jgi:hypothetical protein
VCKFLVMVRVRVRVRVGVACEVCRDDVIGILRPLGIYCQWMMKLARRIHSGRVTS